MKPRVGETVFYGYPAALILRDTYGEFEVLDAISGADFYNDAKISHERIYEAIRKREEEFGSNQTKERRKY